MAFYALQHTYLEVCLDFKRWNAFFLKTRYFSYFFWYVDHIDVREKDNIT